MKRTVLIAIFCCTTTAFAADIKLTTHVVGNPINRQDDYTLNSNTASWVDISCVFTNSGKSPADLQIWVTPDASQPEKSVHLTPASKAAPYQVTEQFHLPLKKHWWCRIYTPHKQQHKWDYCTYFSIADATIAEYKPFGNFDRTVHSKDTSYHCQLKKPDGKTSFFYFM